MSHFDYLEMVDEFAQKLPDEYRKGFYKNSLKSFEYGLCLGNENACLLMIEGSNGKRHNISEIKKYLGSKSR